MGKVKNRAGRRMRGIAGKYCLPLAMLMSMLLISGCLRIPQPSGFPFTEQRKMQAAHHWDVLAADVAEQINIRLLNKGYLKTPVHVRHSCGEPDSCGPGETFPFDEGFNDLLTTRLVALGVPTRPEPEDDCLLVDYKVQVVYHQATRFQNLRPGVITALTAGIMVFRNAPTEILTVASAAAADTLLATSVNSGHYEVVITTSIVDDNLYLMRQSDIYYINAEDFWHYRQNEPAEEIELTGSGY